MSREPSGPTRRVLLTAVALLPLTGCSDSRDASAALASPPPAHPSASPPASPKPIELAALRTLERKYDARLGVYALDTGTGKTIGHRADERFAFCSTFKTLAVAALLDRNPPGHLDERVTYTRGDINSISPVTRENVDKGMTVGQLCDAAIRYSDGTAANLLLRDLGGPERLTDYLRELGDTVSRLDHYEPELHQVRPGDPADTTTPRAIAADYRTVILGDTLARDQRALLTDLLERNKTGGNRIRAGVPKGWRVADKTGTGQYGRANDIAIVWPPASGPLVLAIMSERSGREARPSEPLIAEATEHVTAALT
ncbi:class A beta-lactamase [Streptomyces koyangensis]|uniref:Beta-lactamase n=1 Tax=Streptomyces koyangensis TaxID=188770 RepID=A0A385DJT4_9ACTN|nr:class A beta-lactamase [Streptomyces koyangensis]AXQ58743.1 class A beta-lactamase [Streptomyces koyangensis]